MRFLNHIREFDLEKRLRCEFVATGTALLAAGLASAAGSVASGVIGSGAAKSAADKQVQAQQAALDFQKQVYGENKANQAPFIQAGQGSIQKIIDSINNGTFGPGSIPAPTAFHTPTLEEAQATPGYQFTQQQGNKGILQGAAAAGGAISGGTLKALSQYDTNLANTTYGDVFNRSLQSYGAGINQYQALLSGQAQGYNQLANIASLGENAAANAGNVGVATGAQVGQTLSNLGGAQAAGIVGSANSLISAISGATGSGNNAVTAYTANQQNQQYLDLLYQRIQQGSQQSSQQSNQQGVNTLPQANPAYNPAYAPLVGDNG